MSLVRLGVPRAEIQFSELNVLALEDGAFIIITDLKFERLRKFVPSEPGLGRNHLFAAIEDARWDIYLAAAYNSAFIGNNDNQAIIELILRKAIGAQPKFTEPIRGIYDFISVDTPSIREVINSGARSPREFLKLLDKAKAFKGWLNERNPGAEMIQEILKEKAAGSWMESVPVKVARFGVFGVGGIFTEMLAPGFKPR
jgi:hypothetical protein